MTRRSNFVSHPRPRSNPLPEAEDQPRQTPLEPASEPSSLDALLAEVTALANQLRKTLAEFQPHSLPSAPRQNVLQTLHLQGPQSVPQVARHLHTSRQNIQVLVNCLQAEGSVEFTANPAHKRSDLVALTHQGRTLAATVGRHESELRENLSSRVSVADVRSASELLSKLRHALALQPDSPQEKRPAARRARSSPANATPATQELARPLRVTESEPTASELPVNLL